MQIQLLNAFIADNLYLFKKNSSKNNKFCSILICENNIVLIKANSPFHWVYQVYGKAADSLKNDSPAAGIQLYGSNMSVFYLDRHNGGPNMLSMDTSVREVGLKQL